MSGSEHLARVESLLHSYLKKRGYVLSSPSPSSSSLPSPPLSHPRRPSANSNRRTGPVDPSPSQSHSNHVDSARGHPPLPSASASAGDGDRESEPTVGELAMDLQLAIHASTLAQNLVSHPQAATPEQYEHVYAELKGWIVSLVDVYQNELRTVLWPFFLHIFVALHERGFVADALMFLSHYRKEHEPHHHVELLILQNFMSDPIKYQSLVKMTSTRKTEVVLSSYSLELLITFLESSNSVLGLVLLNSKLYVRILSRRPWKAEYVHVDPRADVNRQSDHAGELRLGVLPQMQQLRETAIEDMQLSVVRKQAWSRSKPEFGQKEEEKNEISAESSNNMQKKQQRSIAEQQSENEAILKEKAMKQASEQIKLFKSVLPGSSFDLPQLDVQQEINAIADLQNRARFSGELLPSVTAFTFLNDYDVVCNAHVTADARYAFAALVDARICCYDLTLTQAHTDGKRQQQFNLCGHRSPVYAMSCNSYSSFLLSAGADPNIKLWHLDSRASLVDYCGHTSTIWDVQWSPLGTHFASCSADRTARLWSSDRIAPLRMFLGHTNDVDCVAWHPNCQYIATGGSDRTVYLWDVAVGEAVRIMLGHTHPLVGMAFDEDGKTLFTADQGGEWLQFDLSTSHVLQRSKQPEPITSIALSHDSKIVATGDQVGNVKLWQQQVNNTRRNQNDPLTMQFQSRQSVVMDVAFSQRNVLFAAGVYHQSNS